MRGPLNFRGDLGVKNLVVGASGQVGNAILQLLREKPEESIGTYYSVPFEKGIQLDLSDSNQVLELSKKINPKFIYLTSSLTNVDYCQYNEEKSYNINVLGVKNLLQAFPNAQFVYFSSDYVFDGKNGPYLEGDVPNPIQIYGVHKLIAERMVCELKPNAIIVRTNMVYGKDLQKKNYTSRLYQSLKAGLTWRAPEDEWVSPTFNLDLAAQSIDLINNYYAGTFHIVGNQQTNRYQFSVDFANKYSFDPELIQPTRAVIRPVPRPSFGGLRSKYMPGLRSHLEVMPHFTPS